MAYIRIRTEQLSDAAESIQGYLEFLRMKMCEAGKEAEHLDQSWQGMDETVFREEWAQLTAKGSSCYQMTEALESYENYLKYVRKIYELAGKNAEFRAKNLP